MKELLAAAGGVTLSVDGAQVRIGKDGGDWFGPGALSRDGVDATVDLTAAGDGHDDIGRFTAVEAAGDGVRVVARVYADEPIIVFRLEATRDLAGIANGSFADPSFAWPHLRPDQRRDGGLPEGANGFGFQYTEFCWPAQSEPSLGAWRILPFRPPVVEPLGVTTPNDGALVLVPLDGFHDQIIRVPYGDDLVGGIRCGWHGDLDHAPVGFATELAVIGGSGPRVCLDLVGSLLQRRHGTVRPARDADALGARVSYWTDNGSAYWYRTEPGHDVPSTLEATVADLRARDIPFASVQLDSWWYPHEAVRPFDTDEWEVPPSGLVRWEPREDILPDGIAALRARLGDPPLVAHCRHVSSSSPYVEELECWTDGDRAHPTGPALYERWLDQCQAWGIETFEHDWLIESFLGVRGLREESGRAAAWQAGLDAAAAARGITLQWCMATPADFLQTVALGQVTSIRTSGDHGYLLGPGDLWAWFLTVNVFARSLGLHPYKDVFHSASEHAEVEALLATLSAGPVGLGDALGLADRDLVLRACRADGAIVRPDVALAAVDRTFLEHPVALDVPLIADAWTSHAPGPWHYVVALHVGRHAERITDEVSMAPLGGPARDGDSVCWDWRRRRATVLGPGGSWPIDLGTLDWDLRVLAPIAPCGLALVGDPSRYATAGDRRVVDVEHRDDRLRFTVLGAGETVGMVGWSARPPSGARAWQPERGWDDLDVAHDDEVWRVAVPVGAAGWRTVEILA